MKNFYYELRGGIFIKADSYEEAEMILVGMIGNYDHDFFFEVEEGEGE